MAVLGPLARGSPISRPRIWATTATLPEKRAMTALLLTNLAGLSLSLSLAAGTPQSGKAGPSAGPEKTAEAKTAAIRALLDETLIETKPFQEDMPLSQFLQALEKQFAKGKRIPLQLDEKAFGKNFPEVAKTPIRLPPFPRRMTLSTALRIALNKVRAKTEAEYRIYPDHFAITTPERALYAVVYDVRDLTRDGSYLLQEIRRLQAARVAGKMEMDDLGPAAGTALLARLILTEVDPESWGATPLSGSIRILNGTKLNVRTTSDRHAMVDDLLTALRRLADLAVVMNARLYEVDRAFYAKQIAPLLVEAKSGSVRRLLAVDDALAKKLERYPLVLKGDELKLRPWEQSRFLSWQTPFRYVAHPGDPKREPAKVYRTVLAGVSFFLHPAVSSDRRCIRLKITQDVAQLIEITKTKVLDPGTGKEVEVESPNVRKTSLTATLEIEDGQAVLMPVEYRPPGAAAKDRVWVMLAEPMIWIEEEQEQIRKANLPPIPKGPFREVAPPKKAAELPDSDDVRQILQAVLTHVLTSKDLEKTRAFYGTPGDTKFAIADSLTVALPKSFRPAVPGYTLVEAPSHCEFDGPRPHLLGISLTKFRLDQKKAVFRDAPIEVVISNFGGTANGAVIGGCTVYYAPRREGKRWAVDCLGSFDP
jgi:hypothetical protein